MSNPRTNCAGNFRWKIIKDGGKVDKNCKKSDFEKFWDVTACIRCKWNYRKVYRIYRFWNDLKPNSLGICKSTKNENFLRTSTAFLI